MPEFGKASLDRLSTCHFDLQRLFKEVVKGFDCTVICGHRGKDEQDNAFHQGLSKVKYPNSKHNSMPSHAADVIPYPIDWSDTDRMKYFAGYVKGIASQMEIKIKWGGDWDQDTELKDETFLDFPHYELVID